MIISINYFNNKLTNKSDIGEAKCYLMVYMAKMFKDPGNINTHCRCTS